MILKNMFSHLRPSKSAPLKAWAMKVRERSRGVDVRSLKPTRPLTEAEKAERYRTGRVAEMTEVQAGL